MFLPISRNDTEGIGLLTVDIIGDTNRAPASANGTTSLQWPAVKLGYLWLVQRISVRSVSTLTPQVVVTAGDRVMYGTYNGNFDFADANSPILVQGGEELGFSWYGIDDGVVATVDIQYELLRRIGYQG